MLKKAIYTSLILILLVFTASSQSFYTVDNNGIVRRVSIKGTSIAVQDVTGCPGYFSSTIAYYNGALYANNNGLVTKADVIGNTFANCSTPLGNTFGGNSMTVDANGVLYIANGNTLYTFNPVNASITILGNMPYSSGGDLVFYKNNLYMASGNGIVKVNIANPALSTLIIPSNLSIFGLASIAVSSTQNKIYALAASGSSTAVIELDLDNNQLGQTIGTLPFIVYDAASATEDDQPVKISIDNVKAFADCPYTGKGTVQVICNEALADYTYTLNGVTNTTGIFTGLDPGTFNITVKSAVEQKSTVVTIAKFDFDKPKLNITKTNPVCVAPGQIKIAAVANGNLYQIKYGSNVFDFDHTFTNLPAGTYHFIIQSKAGCDVDAADVVLTQDLCKITVSNTVISEECNNPGKAAIKINTTPTLDTYTYSINAISNKTGIFDNIDPGAYNVHITSSGGDVKDLPLTVPNYNATKPTLNVTTINPVCDNGGQISITIANPALYRVRYGTDIFPLNHVFVNLAPGAYHFDILKQDNCLLYTKDIVLNKDKCTILLDNTTIAEECNLPGQGLIKINPQPDTYVYSFTLNGTTINSTGIFNNLQPGDYAIKITSSEDEKLINVTIPDYNASKPALTTTSINPVCDNGGQISFIITNPAQYRVKLGTDIFPLNHIFSNLTAGTYHFDILKQDDCILLSKDVVLTRDKCTIQLNNTTITEECNQPGKGVIQINPQAHTYIYTYTLNGTVTNGTGIFNSLQPGDYTVKVTSSEDEKIVNLTVPDYSLGKPGIDYVATRPECDNPGTIKLIINNSSLYRINYNNITYPFDHLFTDLKAGDYHFDVIKQDNCILNSVDITLTRKKCDIILTGAETEAECNIIFKGKITVKSQPHTYVYTYRLNNSITNNTGIFNNLSPGQYNIAVSSNEDVQQISATVPDYKANAPVITFTTKPAICDLKGSATFAMQGSSTGYQIFYDNSSYPFDHNFNNLDGGTHQFTVIKPNGCLLDIITVNIPVEECQIMQFPNAFTPNNDGVNDIFRPSQDSRAESFKFTIYNRQGMLLFLSDDLKKGWDGLYNGKPVPVGEYYWIAVYLTNTRRLVTKSGNITLIR